LHTRHQAAFTLIEILVTLVILSTGIVLVLQAFETAAVALASSREDLFAHELIEDIVADLEASVLESGDCRTGRDGGGSAGWDGDYRWETDVSRLRGPGEDEGEEPDGSAYEVVVTVFREKSDSEYSATTRLRVPTREKP
ncbi:MAG: prepilin-type N-terminal cleavage/methylation domain-containing protein, partial [Lentisphaerae bacterium]|nr:prepilin-type N-terminal cleavage/methylation domain-containing protein [Lentisphaerota bacterium]